MWIYQESAEKKDETILRESLLPAPETEPCAQIEEKTPQAEPLPQKTASESVEETAKPKAVQRSPERAAAANRQNGSRAGKPSEQKSPPFQQSTAEKSARSAHTALIQKKTPLSAFLFGGMYLAGAMTAGLLYGGCTDEQRQLIEFFWSNWVNDFAGQSPSGLLPAFWGQYGPAFAVLTLLFGAGVCALGGVLILLTAFLYGVGTGVIVLQLFAGQSLRGWLIQLPLTIPMAVLTLLYSRFGSTALEVSDRICRAAFGREPSLERRPSHAANGLLRSFVLYSILLILPCGVSAGLAYLLSLLATA